MYIFEIARLFVNPDEVYSASVFFVLRQKSTPVGQLVLLFNIHIANMFIQNTHYPIKIKFLLLLHKWLIDRVVESVIDWLLHWWLRVHLRGVGLSFTLISNLIVNVGIFSCYFFVVNQQCDLAFSVAQFITLKLHLFPSSHSLPYCFILNKHIGPLSRQLVPFDLQISDEAVSTEHSHQIVLVSKLWIISDRSIYYRYQVFFNLVGRVVADHIKSFQMISEKYFEVRVVGVLMKSCIDIVVVCAGIGGILDLKVFDEDEIFDYFDSLYLSIAAEKFTDRLFARFIHSTHIQFPDQDTLVNMFLRCGLFSQFFSF